MLCPNCHTENADTSMFCKNCGQKLPTEAPQEAAFTPAPNPEPADPAQPAYGQDASSSQQQDSSYSQQPSFQQGPASYQQPSYGQNASSYQQPSYRQVQDPVLQGKVKTSLIVNIIFTILNFLCCTCCMIGVIPGIIGIVSSSKANKNLEEGNFSEAEKKLKTAQIMMWIGIALFALSTIVYVILTASGTIEDLLYATSF